MPLVLTKDIDFVIETPDDNSEKVYVLRGDKYFDNEKGVYYEIRYPLSDNTAKEMIAQIECAIRAFSRKERELIKESADGQESLRG